ncbi:MAG: alpha/beta hydrolase [Bacteroidota bacterium]
MDYKKIIFLLFTFFNLYLFAQKDENITLTTKTGNIEGTLLLPVKEKNIPIALIIAGSGPTDRDGNNPYMKNNSLKMLATGLLENGIATLRYDKRGIANSKDAALKESDLRFENYIDDAEQWIALLKKDKRFNKIIVIGHSEGSLIGMIASQKVKVDKFISIAGVGRPAAVVIADQLKSQSTELIEISQPIIDKLNKGETVEDVPQMLFSIFRPSVQPYIISWFKYDPQIEIKKLQIPVLIVQGTTDIQVTTEDAELLKKANSKVKLEIIEGMNHIMKESEIDRQKNIQTYSLPDLPLKVGLVDVLVEFIY